MVMRQVLGLPGLALPRISAGFYKRANHHDGLLVRLLDFLAGTKLNMSSAFGLLTYACLRTQSYRRWRVAKKPSFYGVELWICWTDGSLLCSYRSPALQNVLFDCHWHQRVDVSRKEPSGTQSESYISSIPAIDVIIVTFDDGTI